MVNPLQKPFVNRTLTLIQKELTAYYQDKIRELAPPPSFIKKQMNLSESFFSKTPIHEIQATDLSHTIAHHDVICVGDYHTFYYSQKVFSEIIQQFHQNNEKAVVVLESIPSQKNKILSQILDQHIPIKSVMDKLNFKSTWDFDSQGTEVILSFCRKNNIPTYGMNLTKGFYDVSQNFFMERELHFIKTLQKIKKKHPNQKLFVLVGDIHLLPHNLPMWWSQTTKTSLPMLCIHQNSDEIYWRLKNRASRHTTSYFKINPQNYVLINTRPWVKYHSYLHLLEKSIEYESYTEEESLEEAELSRYDQFLQLLSQLSKLLNVKNETKIPPFTSYSSLEFDLPLMIKNAPFLTFREKKGYLALFKEEIPFFIPESRTLYCPHHTANMMTDACLRMLHSHVTGWQSHFRGTRANFYSWIILEAYIFALSKLMNPARKPLSLTHLTPHLGTIWPKCLNYLRETDVNWGAWLKIASLFSTLQSKPQAQYRLLQWIGQRWGLTWATHFTQFTIEDLDRFCPSNTAHQFKASKKHFFELMQQSPFKTTDIL